jgi:cyclophilin family peptidyl-prolyl cis-trans isomerase/HEAT repeat protein
MSPILHADRLPATYRHPTPAATRVFAACALLIFLSAGVSAQGRRRQLQNPTVFTEVPKQLLLQIVRAEDERRWDNDMRSLLSARSAVVRRRAALAAGRIGNDAAVADLVALLQHDGDPEVRVMAAFALGEIESPLAADTLVDVLKNSPNLAGHARVLEALGKIAAALPKEQATRAQALASVVLETLAWENRRRSASDELTVLLGLTAVLRAKPDNAGPIVAEFLRFQDPRIRADAANTLARLRLKDGNDELRKLLTTDPDPIVRANAARVLGATEDKASFDELLRALKDSDSRVRVSAIRALASLKDARAAEPLLDRGEQLLRPISNDGTNAQPFPTEVNELLEIATTIGRLLPNSKNIRALDFLRRLRFGVQLSAPEVEVAFARVSPQFYHMAAKQSLLPAASPQVSDAAEETAVWVETSWLRLATVAQGIGELASVNSGNPMLDASLKVESVNLLTKELKFRPVEPSARRRGSKSLPGVSLSGVAMRFRRQPVPPRALPDFLRALAAFKQPNVADKLRDYLEHPDVVVRGTAADLLGELPPDETNARALVAALPIALADKDLNDAALSVLDSLAKQKSNAANDAIKTALGSGDYLVRRRAVALLQANGVGDFSSRIGTVRSRNTTADYQRALARIGKRFNAVVTTSRGSFTIELLPEDAPLTVDNFIQLARRGYFREITIHRVVPNFVIQDGDPRGDGNGGPGYQIRCEINEASYERGALGMALSGKDTGGSQWFITHSPQPHLDGGYTVFGKVIAGMEVVDAIVRGDVIRSITIVEPARGAVK